MQTTFKLHWIWWQMVFEPQSKSYEKSLIKEIFLMCIRLWCQDARNSFLISKSTGCDLRTGKFASFQHLMLHIKSCQTSVLNIAIIRIIVHISAKNGSTSDLIDLHAVERFTFSVSRGHEIHIWVKKRKICEIPERNVWESYLALADSSQRLLCVANNSYSKPHASSFKSAHTISVHSFN